MRALIVTNMWPTAVRARRSGSFVRDQVDALRALDGVEVEVFAFPPGRLPARRARRCAAATARERFDVVHAHFGLTAWPALAAARRAARRDAPRHRPAPPALAADHAARRCRSSTSSPPVSAELAREVPGAGERRRVAVLPCGVDLDRFAPHPARRGARAPRPGRPTAAACCSRPTRRAPTSASTARSEVAGDTRLLTLGRVHPDEVPLWVNAANAVLVPSDARGLRPRRARGARLRRARCSRRRSACTRPRSTASPGTLCAPFDARAWRAGARAATCRPPDPRVAGRDRAALWSAGGMARRVLEAWGEVLRLPVEAPRSGCRFRMKGPLHAIRRRRSERPANGVDTEQAATGGADRGAAHREPVVGSASRAAADQAQPTAELRGRPPADAPRPATEVPRRPGARPRPPELPPPRPAAPAPALPAPRARARLPRPRRPRLRPAPLRAGQHDARRRQARRARRASTRELRALEHALDDRRPLTELREPGVVGRARAAARCTAARRASARRAARRSTGRARSPRWARP